MWFLTLRAKCMEKKKKNTSILSKYSNYLQLEFRPNFYSCSIFSPNPATRLHQELFKRNRGEVPTIQRHVRSNVEINDVHQWAILEQCKCSLHLPLLVAVSGQITRASFNFFDMIKSPISHHQNVFYPILYRADFASSAFEAIYLDLCPLSFHYFTCSQL